MDEAEPHGIEHDHEYNRNGSSCRFHGYGFSWPDGNYKIGLEGDEFGRESRCALELDLEESVVNDQVLALDPTVIAQATAPRLAT